MKKHNDIFEVLRKIIQRKQIKGLIVGYPLDENGNTVVHANFVERWISHMWSRGVGVRIPITLVNEYGSTLSAKVHIAE